MEFQNSIADPGIVSDATSIPVAGQLTPPQIVTAYNIPSSTGANIKVGIVSLGGGWQASDFNASMANLGLSITAANITTVLVDGAANIFSTSDNNASLENTLDLYCVGSMVPSANIILYIGQNSYSGFANVVNQAVNANCDVISISWGGSESNGDYLSAPFANAVAQGTTILCSTGDFGSEISGVETADYPATNSNVIAVGGTNLILTGSNTRSSETVFNNRTYAGGGGISTIINVPAWQNNLTYTTYPGNVTHTLTAGNVGRGVPDISGPFGPYALWYNGSVQTGILGTSASTPVLAGMLARYISINKKRPPINSLHTLFYEHSSSLNKSTANVNLTTGNNSIGNIAGYSATSSWDPVTGLGVPIGNLLYQTVTSGGLEIKNSANTWGPVANVYVKTGASTWANVRNIWTKTADGWAQTY
jgi:kumamolisin